MLSLGIAKLLTHRDTRYPFNAKPRADSEQGKRSIAEAQLVSRPQFAENQAMLLRLAIDVLSSVLICIAAIAFALLATAAQAEETRCTLRGRFVYDGEPPVRKPLLIDKDKKACAKELLDERLIVDAKTRGIANVVVQLYVPPGKDPPKHPQIDQLRETSSVWRIEDCRLEPHICKVLTKQTFMWENLDPVAHPIKMDVLANQPPSDVIPGRGSLRKIYDKRERSPVQTSCSIHIWIRGYLVSNRSRPGE
jgi:hypothetical protein